MSYCAGIIGLVLFLLPTSLRADTIVLNSGRTIQGKIVSKHSDSIVVDEGVEGVSLTYYLDEISKIIPDNPSEDAVDLNLPTIEQEPPSVIADRLENQAVKAIDQGDVDRGLALMAQVLEKSPSPFRYMNYGSVLFGNGVAAFKAGKQELGLGILREAEKALLKAVEGFDKDKDAINISHSCFLLGEMFAYAFNDKDKAKAYYQQSLVNYDNPASAKALEELEGKKENR